MAKIDRHVVDSLVRLIHRRRFEGSAVSDVAADCNGAQRDLSKILGKLGRAVFTKLGFEANVKVS